MESLDSQTAFCKVHIIIILMLYIRFEDIENHVCPEIIAGIKFDEIATQKAF